MGIDFEYKSTYDINDLQIIMSLLRSENGCPWDKEQTHQSIRNNLIEEAYEVIEAIDEQNVDLLKEELGDVLLQVVFHSQIETEQNRFNFQNVCNDICQKLIIRHPHIFADIKVNNTQEVLSNWEDIKKTTKGHTTATQTLQAVPKVLPALMRSAKVQSRAAKTGFDYPKIADAFSDLKSEVIELEEAIKSQNNYLIQEELGDLLFACVNVSRFVKVDAEQSLYNACEKFIKRFEKVEELALQKNLDMKICDMQKLDELWKQAKELCNS